MKARQLLNLLENYKRILVVDDEADICTIIREYVTDAFPSADAVCETTFSKALRTIENYTRFDLVITDTLSSESDVNGITGLKIAKAAASRGSKVIITSGSHVNYPQLAQFTIHKPFTREEIVSAIGSCLGSSPELDASEAVVSSARDTQLKKFFTRSLAEKPLDSSMGMQRPGCFSKNTP